MQSLLSYNNFEKFLLYLAEARKKDKGGGYLMMSALMMGN